MKEGLDFSNLSVSSHLIHMVKLGAGVKLSLEVGRRTKDRPYLSPADALGSWF